jgi:diphthine-ammonia ligase
LKAREEGLDNLSRIAVSWTGGKDSTLALYEAEMLGGVVDCLVTFAPSQVSLLAHPLAFLAVQAQALGLPHYVFNVKEPFDLGYEDAILSVKKKRGISALVTGDIGEVAGHDPDWMTERCRRCDVNLIKPLWRRDRTELLKTLLSLKFKVVFSCVKKPWFTDEWLGTELSSNSIERLIEISKRTGLDISGEQGEYHTLVLDGARFKKRIHIGSYSKHIMNSIMYILLENLRLEDKT